MPPSPFNLVCTLPTRQTFEKTVPAEATLEDAYNAVAVEVERVLGRPVTPDNLRLILYGAGMQLENNDKLLSDYKGYFSGNDVNIHVVFRNRPYRPVNNAQARLANATPANRMQVSRVAANAARAARAYGVAANGGASRKSKSRKNRKNRKTRRN